MKTCILGCGHGGMALAFHYTKAGHSVRIWSDKQYSSKLSGLINGTGIQASGCIEGFINVEMATLNLQEAMKNTDVIFICLPRHAHLSILKKLVNYINEDQIVVIFGGRFSGVELTYFLENNNITKKIRILETNTFPYASRSDTNGNVNILGIKTLIGIAGDSLEETHSILKKFNGELFPVKRLNIYNDTIQLGLETYLGITHPINTLFNAARIDNNDHDFFFYKDGISKKTCRVHQEIDNERMAICELCGYKPRNYVEIINEFYSDNFDNIYDSFTTTTVHNNEKLVPNSLNHRYVTEEVPYLLVPWYLLGRKKGFEANSMKSVIHLFSLMNNQNYFNMGKYIENLE